MLGYGQSPQLLQSGYSQGYWGSPQILGAGFGTQQPIPFAPQAFGPQQFQLMGAGAQAANPIDDIAEDIADNLSPELAERILVATHSLLQAQYGAQVAPLWSFKKIFGRVKDVVVNTGKRVLTDVAKNTLGQVISTLQVQPQAAFGYGGYAGALPAGLGGPQPMAFGPQQFQPMGIGSWQAPYARPLY
jgi:hypothetical protein